MSLTRHGSTKLPKPNTKQDYRSYLIEALREQAGDSFSLQISSLLYTVVAATAATALSTTVVATVSAADVTVVAVKKIYNLESDLHNSQQKVGSLESKLQQSFDMMKAYLMMKEGGIPEALVGFFSAREANDAESESTTPFEVRRSAGDSNGHPKTNI
ncbi:hypothetical protein Ahy_B03g063658 [Arachis hypogaea]|uniref:Uncharacterized protein n=1 Tax=Arachis hypogaea TaxID=3818 RepID=A0A444ZXP5_ARAHY|nr:hypothetical protein Ahy_B03g063658 [Arachis hypogaea]